MRVDLVPVFADAPWRSARIMWLGTEDRSFEEYAHQW